MFLYSFLILCFTHVCLPATNYDIIWDQNYCNEKDRYNNYLLPHNSPCSFCFGDVITLHINSTSVTYENLYRVPTATDMINCNATVNDNTQSIVFNDRQEITIRAGGSEAALSFQLQPDAYYFISTSNGTQFSADNDVIQSPNSCLQLAFTVLLDNNAGCGNYTANCVFNSVFTDPSSSLFCSNTWTTNSGTMTTMGTTSTTPFPTTNTTTQTTATPISTVGLSIIFYVNTTDSPDLIAGLYALLAICIIFIFIFFIFGIVCLPLFWFGKIPDPCSSTFILNPKRRRKHRLSNFSYKERTGVIEIGHPQAQPNNEESPYVNLEQMTIQ
ncbi:hypothetical protein LOD99_8868 [Oopsacas minuta]|uniref:Uncharacterized protein n=1 Tax=Oopsacas minuta TaxID=111878 RepID=A0AAV7JEC9_9METZ|nr:hypothetical protein LOD99_8868 [Oopsacas minuta]